jgi:hypothetical protein
VTKDKKDKKAGKKGGVEEPAVMGVDSPMPPADPDEKLIFDAHLFAVNAVGTLVW